ncbi:MAG: hypothetical protein ACYTGR_15055 [Planctomycetota bacterium]|jgi:uncharacterized membrane protein
MDPRFGRYSAQASRVASTWRVVNAQPNWVARTAAMAGFLILAIPIILLIGFALVVATLLFMVLAAANWVIRTVKGVLPRDDGRENVRVIRRQ